MIPEELYKRRHFSTPWLVLLIMTNYIVVCVLYSIYHGIKPNWFFWIVLAVLGVYNFFELRKNREEITKATVIVLITSLVVLIGVYFLF